jgi:hypothetical protein
VPVGPVPALGEVVAGRLQERVQLVPAGVAAGGQGLADAGLPVAQAYVAFAADCVGELGEPAVLLGDDEVRVVGRRLAASGAGVPEGRFRERAGLAGLLALGRRSTRSSFIDRAIRAGL